MDGWVWNTISFPFGIDGLFSEAKMLVSESVFEMCSCAVYVQDGSNQLLGGHLQETQDRFQPPKHWTHSTPAKMGDF